MIKTQHSLRAESARSSQKGVAAIFFVLVFGVLIGFFMIILNTGVLVYQKIRLQSAVDLAAYAAASVQASYLGNDASGEESIRAINGRIMERYGRLLNDLQFGNVAIWPVLIPDRFVCSALCQGANLMNGARAKSIYEEAARDLAQLRQEAERILRQLPEAARLAAEETLRLNVPDLAIESDGLEALISETTNETEDILRVANDIDRDEKNPTKRKNAILTFTSERGMYLANVVGSVQHSFAYYGPLCADMYYDADVTVPPGTPRYFCPVNGAGFPGGVFGVAAAMAAFARSYVKESSGNIGNLSSISDSDANALRLFFIQNPHKPEPFALVAAEWYPTNGVFMNVENSLAASGSLFPKATKLMAIAAAEPYGGDLTTQSANQFGVRLQSIRRLLLDPRMSGVKEDYPNLYEYFGSVGPKDADGQPTESARDTIKRFLH